MAAAINSTLSLKNQAIGIFDSGVGGLTVAREIRKLLPHEDIIYIADSANAPYGHKTSDFIQQRSLSITQALTSFNVKAVVVACNTATVHSIAMLRQEFQFPIIGIEPGIKPAILKSQTKSVAVLATAQTLKSHSFHQLKERFKQEAQIHLIPCLNWVEIIEEGDLSSPRLIKQIEETLQSIPDKYVDTYVLGCTHYPLIKMHIRQILGHSIQIIDTGEAVALEVKRRLQNDALLKDEITDGWERFYSTRASAADCQLLTEIWGKETKIESLSIQHQPTPFEGSDERR
ncbi:MAG: glutamate racemase [Gammaproteobacteria bacterium CG22_combo_CG10-13_8_21_14_all_40_8]|nr:MAG: glutamate racemase [Gammaproteobacteria bacterium CG22_combo_CG10-13_8_21_14_all_40_8]